MSEPMREPSLWVLLALASGRRHGYGLLAAVRELSDESVTLRVTTLYAIVDRLLEQGLIRSDGEEVVDGRVRRYFVLTDSGDQRLAAEVERLDSTARRVRTRFSAIAKGTSHG